MIQILPFNHGPINRVIGTEFVKFRPTSEIRAFSSDTGSLDLSEHDYTENPLEGYVKQIREMQQQPILGARFIVGFNVGDNKTWNIQDVRAQLFILRENQLKQQYSAGLIPQERGPGFTLYESEGVFGELGKKAIIEHSAQLFILNLDNDPQDLWNESMVSLAIGLGERLSQRAIILELQKGGLVYYAMPITNDESAWVPVSQIKRETREFNATRLHK